ARWLDLAARPAAARVAAAAAAEPIAAPTSAPAAPAAPSAATDVDGALLARQLLVILAPIAATRVGAPLDDVREPAAPVGGLVDDLLIDGHPGTVARAFVRADRGVGEPVHHHADQERDPAGAASQPDERDHRQRGEQPGDQPRLPAPD